MDFCVLRFVQIANFRRDIVNGYKFAAFNQ